MNLSQDTCLYGCRTFHFTVHELDAALFSYLKLVLLYNMMGEILFLYLSTGFFVEVFIFKKGGVFMHLSDGVLSLPAVAATSAAAGGMLIYSIKGIKEEEIPKVSLMTATFFTFSLIRIPVGPSSIHPLLGGLLGVILGRRSTLAVFAGLLLQALLFQHGGLTTLGMNTIMVAVPAMVCHGLYLKVGKNKSVYLAGGLVGALAVALSATILSIVLFFSNSAYHQGLFSVINLLLLGHLPLIAIEGILTAFAIAFMDRTRPHLLSKDEKNNIPS